MKKIAILLMICLTLSALAGCARADESGKEMATLTQPEQIIQKDEVAKKEEPADIDSADELEEGTKVPAQPQEQPKEELVEKETDTPQTTEKKRVVCERVPDGSQFDLYAFTHRTDECLPKGDVMFYFLTFEELQAKLDPETSIVFRGTLNGKSTQYTLNKSRNPYTETPILVQEIYYGNAKAGAVIAVCDEAYVALHDGAPVLHCYKRTKLFEKEREYFFVLHNIGPLHDGGADVYSTKGYFTRVLPVSKLETLQGQEELSSTQKLELDALTYYYLGQRGEEK